MSIYYNIITALIAKGRVDGLEQKIDILWLDTKISDEERDYFIGLLKPETDGVIE